MTKGTAFLSAFSPSVMSYQLLKDIFVQEARHRLLDRLMQDVWECATSPTKRHTLIVGARGMGKTHLVTLLYHRIRSAEESADIDKSVRIAWLKEEERGVRSFGHLARRILERLAAEYRDSDLKNETDALLNSPADFEERATQLLTKWLKGYTLLLIVENFNDLLTRIGEGGQRAFRAYLQNEQNALVLATTPILTEEMSDYESPFYGFFNVEALEELSLEDAALLLARVAKEREDGELSAFLKTPQSRNRLKVIEALAGGHPRIWILFASVLTKDTLDELVPLFLKMLDDLTPYYQSRLDTLSPQQAQVVECLIEKRGAVAVSEIARYCMMESPSVSVQLRRLGEQGYVRNARMGRDNYYELREPLMRLALEVKESRGKPIQLIVDFLRHWYDRSALEERLASCSLESRYERSHIEAALALMPVSDSIAVYLPKFGQTRVTLEGEQGYAYSSLGDALNRGILFSELGRFKEALESYERAVEIDPQCANAWYNRGVILGGMKRYDEALESYDKAVEIDPQDANAWYNRGVILGGMKRYEEALESYDKALEIDPQCANTWNNRGGVLDDMKRYAEALESYDKALEIDPRDASAWYNRGVILGGMKRYEEALESVDKALEIDPESALALSTKAEIYLMTGDWTHCLSTLDVAFSYPSSKVSSVGWKGHGRDICRALLENIGSFALWDERIETLASLYNQHSVLLDVAMRMVQAIPALFAPHISDAVAEAWNRAWQKAGRGEGREALEIPLRLLDAAVRWREKRDDAVLLSLPAELRPILEELLAEARG